jgi:hypothetical protein
VNKRERVAADELLRDYHYQITRAGKSKRWSAERREAMQEANRLMPKVNGLMLSLVPDTAPISGTNMWQHRARMNQVMRAWEILTDWDSMIVDDDAEVQFGLPLNALEVYVLEAAREDWGNGHWRQAVASAAAMLNEVTQRRLGVHDISDSKLMGEAFLPEPPQKGRPRLRCPGDPANETVRAMQKGAQLFAMGAMMAIRNPATHRTINGNPASAAEQLAALSVIGRWVKYWDVERWTPPLPTITPPTS